MKKFFIITGFVLLSSIPAAAQTASEPRAASDATQVEFTKRAETDAPIMPPKMGAKRSQTERIVDGRVIRVGPTTTYLKNGLSTDEVVRLLGRPSSVSERLEDGRLVTIYVFPRSVGRVLIAEFENGLLIASRTETPDRIER